MIGSKTRRYAKEVTYHPYVDWGILPMVGDFVGQVCNVLNRLYDEEVLSSDQLLEANSWARAVHEHQDKQALENILFLFNSIQ